MGIIYLFASVIAGAIWVINPIFAFIFAAFMALVATIVFISIFWKRSLVNFA